MAVVWLSVGVLSSHPSNPSHQLAMYQIAKNFRGRRNTPGRPGRVKPPSGGPVRPFSDLS